MRIDLLELFNSSLMQYVIHGRAGAEAPQQQVQQQAQPIGELSEHGEENTAPQPPPDDAGADSGQALDWEGTLLVHSRLQRIPHTSWAHASNIRSTCTKPATGSSLKRQACATYVASGLMSQALLAALQVQRPPAAEPSQAVTASAAQQQRVLPRRRQELQGPRA
jgi:hypothetical protein